MLGGASNLGGGSGGGGTPGGSNQQLQYNNSGVFGGAAALYFDNATSYFGAGLLNTGTVTLTHPFQVGGGNSIIPPASVSGAITYYTPPSPPSGSSISGNYFTKQPDPTSITASQVDGFSFGVYVADGTVNLTFYVSAYTVVSGTKIRTSGLTNVVFTDNSDLSQFYIQLDWAPVAGATGYQLWRNGTFNGNTSSFETIDLAAALSLQDTGAFWAAGVAYPPTPTALGYQALGNTTDYHIYDYTVNAGVNVYSATSTNLTFTDDNRSQHGPTSGSISSSTSGGTYYSANNNTHSYVIFSAYPDGGYSSTSLSKSLNVPNLTVGTPSGFTAIPNYGSGSYTANGNFFTYYVKAYKSTPTGYVFSGTAAASFTDDGSTNPFSVDLAWTAPAGVVPDGYLVYLNGGQFALQFNSVNVGNVVIYNDNAAGWSTSYPFNLGGLSTPSSLTANQNDAEVGYTADGTNIFTYNLASSWSTPLGVFYSAPSSCPAGFTDNGDLSTFGVDLAWAAEAADPNGTNASSYQLWVVGASHALNTSQNVGLVTSFADQNNSWSTLNYQPSGSAAYSFSYEILLSWTAVPAISSYYVIKTGGDSGPSYPIFISSGPNSLTDTDDSIWTAGAVNPPTPVEQPTSYEIFVNWTGVGGVTYRPIRQVNGGGFTTYHDTAPGDSGFIDGNYSFSWLSSPTVTNTLYHATGANIPIKAYSFNNADAIYSSTFASNSVTDDNSGRYYSVLWTSSAYPASADKLKFIINTSNGELLTSPTLTYTDTNGSIAYNSDLVITPSAVVTKFYADRLGAVNVDTLTAATYIVTPKIGNGTGIFQLGAGAAASHVASIAFGNGSTSQGVNSIAIGTGSTTFSDNDICIGTNTDVSGGGVVVGNGASALNGGTALGAGAAVNGGGLAIGTATSTTGGIAIFGTASNNGFAFGGTASNNGAVSLHGNASGINSLAGPGASATSSNSVAFGTSASAGQNAFACGNSATAGTFSISVGYVSSATGGTDIAIGFGATSAGNDAAAVGVSSNISSGSNFGAVFGYNNRLQNTSTSSLSAGYSNTINNSLTAQIIGANSTITSSNNSTICGPSGTITSSAASQILGLSNSITSSSTSLAAGYNNSISSSPNSYVLGQSNTVSGASGGFGTFTFGAGNNISGISSFAIGQGISVGAGFMGIGYGSTGPTITLNSNTNRIGINQGTPAFLFDINGTLNAKIYRFQGSSSGAVTVQPAAAAGSWTWTIPTTAGTANYFLQTDGAGVTTWASAATIQAHNDLTAQSAAVSSLCTFTPSATGTFEVGGYLTVTAVSLDVIALQVTYIDETSTSRTLSLLAGISATGVNNASTMAIRAKISTAITVKTTLTTGTGSITYDVGGFIKQIA